MASPHDWIDYLGAFGGVVGVITGTLGAVFGLLAYRRTNAHKRLDLRRTLREQRATLRFKVEGLPEIIGQADKSRQASMAADGLRGSGQAQLWEKAIAADQQKAKDLLQRAPAADEDYAHLDEPQLESELVTVYALSLEVDKLRSTYSAALKKDEDDAIRRKAAAEARAIGRQ